MIRQRSAKTKHSNENPTATKSLSVRYAELLRLREAVSKTESDLEFADLGAF